MCTVLGRNVETHCFPFPVPFRVPCSVNKPLAWMAQPRGGGKQEWDKCLHLDVLGNGIPYKWKCYTGMTIQWITHTTQLDSCFQLQWCLWRKTINSMLHRSYLLPKFYILFSWSINKWMHNCFSIHFKLRSLKFFLTPTVFICSALKRNAALLRKINPGPGALIWHQLMQQNKQVQEDWVNKVQFKCFYFLFTGSKYRRNCFLSSSKTT